MSLNDDRAEWQNRIATFLRAHPKLKTPSDFDIQAFSKSLSRIQLQYSEILEPQEREHLSQADASNLMGRIHYASRNLKLLLIELSESSGNRRHLAETITGSLAPSARSASESDGICDIDEDGEALLSQLEKSVPILDAQSRVLWEQYEGTRQSKHDSRHSRSAAVAFGIYTNSKAWLIGTALTESYRKHFGQWPPINHSAKAGQSTRTGAGLEFIHMALDAMGVSHWSGGSIPAETIRSIVRKARKAQKSETG